MTIIRICTIISTLGSIGYFGASGTVATIVTLPLVYWTHDIIPSQRLYLGFIVCAFAASMWIEEEQQRWEKRSYHVT